MEGVLLPTDCPVMRTRSLGIFAGPTTLWSQPPRSATRKNSGRYLARLILMLFCSPCWTVALSVNGQPARAPIRPRTNRVFSAGRIRREGRSRTPGGLFLRFFGRGGLDPHNADQHPARHRLAVSMGRKDRLRTVLGLTVHEKGETGPKLELSEVPQLWSYRFEELKKTPGSE